MNCRQVQDLLLDYLEHELDDQQYVAVEEHLQACPACEDYCRDLEETLGELTQAGDDFSEPPPDSFPGYQIIRELHRGGQGIVYQAVQESTKRKVAVKVMKEGPFAGPGDQARFDREVQILGQLNHPNIIAVHDTGVAAGCHYFVMDYISGRALDEHMQGGKRLIDQILRLFVKMCEAVNAAHLRGIIHRDLKPSNIRIDDEGEPHILDFGLAKVATGDAPASLMTMTGQFIGSLRWASPEQAEGKPGMIDLRTDVYSLGVILYEMLTGRFPYEVIGNMRDVLDRIMTAEPHRPSTIRPQINNEIETIVLKCLSKERDRRYQSAGELARDVQHYLNGEPIEAKRDSVGYLLRKQLRRYRLPTAIAAAFVLVVTTGFVTSLAFWQREVRQRELADASAQRANREAAKAEAVNVFLQGMLASAGPEIARGREVAVREVLDQAARDIDAGTLADQPEIEAAVRATIGNTYRSMGLYVSGEPHLRTALDIRRRLFGPQNSDLAASLNDLAFLLYRQGDYEEAETFCRQALTMCRDLFGDDHLATADSLDGLACLLSKRGDLAQAEPLFREALAVRRRHLGDQHPDVGKTLNNLAGLLYHRGQYAAAEPLYREALAMNRERLGDDHPDVCRMARNLAVALQAQGDYAAAEPLFREVLRIRRTLYPGPNVNVASALADLGRVLIDRGRCPEAETLLRECLSIRLQKLPPGHWLLDSTRSLLGDALTTQGKFDRAEPLLLEAHAGMKDNPRAPAKRKRELLERLVRLYQAWDKPDQTARWQAELPPPSAEPTATPPARTQPAATPPPQPSPS